MENFNLSKEINETDKQLPVNGTKWVYEEDVKEFIKRLKEEFEVEYIIPDDYIRFLKLLDKLAGDKLI